MNDALLLTVNNLYGGYVPEVDILQGVSLFVQPGELVTIIGANGAGKSTLARAIFGLMRVSQGEITFDGRPIVGLPPEQLVRLGMGYVPQVANVFPSLTINENLEMGAFTSKQDTRAKKEEIYSIFPTLARKQRQKAGTLSGGERQMLAMGRALMVSPKLLILDEPSAALSPILVKEIFQLILRIKEQGTAILLVEQNARQALAIADRGYVMDSGKVAFTDTGKALLDNPKVVELYLGFSDD
ncbi:MAG: ABC transporter ATP-binding protein [Pseudanabaenaceae cyanobacterium SKYGB_i_bin29]|nr:ABC transporter ATP-binding protein [Pseudanabaenaceae cyanobacterium SKYG29]MDW8420816.1 ABC transporter ATP-binding protein [Pseudanabaenaceae cyanobacterium SKYGB_i_bin29]